MSLLEIGEGGLELDGSSVDGFDAALAMQAFVLELDDGILQGLIECAENGGAMEMSLGEDPAIIYGSNTHELEPLDETFCEFDLYTSRLSDKTTTAERFRYPTMSFWRQPKPKFLLNPPHKPTVRLETTSVDKNGKTHVKSKPLLGTDRRASSSPPDVDSDIEALALSLAQDKDRKSQNVTQVVSNMPASSKRSAKVGKFLPARGGYSVAGTPRSMPPSPALNGLASPSLAPTMTAGQKKLEQSKEQRRPIVHELAVREQPLEYLENIWEGDEKDLKPVLDKIADYNESTQKYALKNNYWKELDVWAYDYESREERQFAIDNAIKKFDKLRLSAVQEEWQKLLPAEDRGKGICLSKTQAKIASGAGMVPTQNPAPTIKVQKPEDSDKNDSDQRSGSEKAKAKGGEPMARSSSSPLPAKKSGTGDAQMKRLLVNKQATKKAATPTPKAPAKPVKDDKNAKDRPKVLSSAVAVDSSSSDEDAPLSSTVAKTKKPASSERQKPAVLIRQPKPLPAPTKDTTATRDTIRALVGVKRARSATDDEDSSSSSGAPLSKRSKPKEAAASAPARPAAKPASSSQSQTKHGRTASDSSSSIQAPARPTTTTTTITAATTIAPAANASSSNSSFKNNNSPAKSSPLASSPPTNASELDNSTDEQRTPPNAALVANNHGGVNNKKRKAAMMMDGKPPNNSNGSGGSTGGSNKRPRVSDELVTMAAKFKAFYDKYEKLHYQLVDQKNPDEAKLSDLRDMRGRLETMKHEIYRETNALEGKH